MVASDTIVGLVGAGILVVALVGVFVYESGDVGNEYEVRSAEPAYTAEGNAKVIAARGTPVAPPVGPAVCDARAGCELPRTEVMFNATNMPILTDLEYVGFLTGPNNQVVPLGKLTFSAGKHTLSYSRSENQGQSTLNTFVVSLEKASSASSPSLPIYTKSIAAGPSNSLGGGAKVSLASGTHALQLDDSAGNVQAEITFSGVANRTGLEYRAWLKRADGSYDHLVNYTGSSLGTTTLGGTLTGGAEGSVEDYTEFVVTLENPGSGVGRAGGFPVVSSALTT